MTPALVPLRSSALGVLAAMWLTACSNGGPIQPPDGFTVFGGPGNPAPDGSYTEAIAELSAIQTDPVDWDQVGTLEGWLEELGLGDIHDHSLLPAFAAEAGPLTEYTPEDEASEGAWRALYDDSPLITDPAWLRTLDLIDRVPRLEVPVYFMAGRYDYKTPGVLVEEYASALEAPAGTQVFWFERSAHVPFIEERSRFHALMIGAVLADDGT